MKNQEGQTMIEAVVAMSAAVIVMIAITGAVVISLNNATSARSQSQSAQFANEGIEFLRNKKNNDWKKFNEYNGEYCLPLTNGKTEIVSTICDSPNIDNNIFIRKATIKKGSDKCPGSVSETEVSVTVSWSDNKCTSTDIYCRSTKVSSCFANTNPTVGL